jgi:hypothetical protein
MHLLFGNAREVAFSVSSPAGGNGRSNLPLIPFFSHFDIPGWIVSREHEVRVVDRAVGNPTEGPIEILMSELACSQHLRTITPESSAIR